MKNSILDLSTACYADVVGHKFDMAILPWGATEPHNYHLPYMTDAILSHRISVDAAVVAQGAGVKAMVLPAVCLGSQNPGQTELPFCLHAGYETQCAILKDIVWSLHHQGVKKLLIVNGHGGNSFKNMIRDIALYYPDFLIACCEWYRLANGHEFFENKGEHADELETSVMLHYHPELVDMSVAGEGKSNRPALKPLAEGSIWMPRNWSEISIDTGIGDPRKATAEKGGKFASAVIEKLSQIVIELSRSVS